MRYLFGGNIWVIEEGFPRWYRISVQRNNYSFRTVNLFEINRETLLFVSQYTLHDVVT